MMLYNGEVQVDFFENMHRYSVDGKRKFGATTYTGILDKSAALMGWAVKEMAKTLEAGIDEGREINKGFVQFAKDSHRRKSEEAKDKGKEVHEYADEYAKAQIAGSEIPQPPQGDEEVTNGCIAFLDWVNTHGIRFVDAERLGFSREYDYCGFVDQVFTMDATNHEVLHIGDIKTGNPKKVTGQKKGEYIIKGYMPYPEHRLQVGGYQNMLVEEDVYTLPFGSQFITYLSKENGNFNSFEIPEAEIDVNIEAFLACVKLKNTIKLVDKLPKA